MADKAVTAARFVARSPGFRECIDAAMRSQVTLSRYGKPHLTGPYQACQGDPMQTNSLPVQVEAAMFAVTGTNDTLLTCTTRTDFWGRAPGSQAYGNQAVESFEVGVSWRNLARSDNGFTATNADFYQRSRAQAVNTIWHEAMHRWHYNHDCSTQTTLANSMNQIAGHCMETMMLRSANCPDTACPAATRAVKRFNSETCDCVWDPAFDVGVIPAEGAACWGEETSFRMDDEDNGNTSSATGWVGSIRSAGDTTFRVCRLPGVHFKPIFSTSVDDNYAVLRMGTTCPTGSRPITRYFDNEDTSNSNSVNGHLLPTLSNRDTRLELCLFPASPQGLLERLPDFRFNYGVFASERMKSALEFGTIRTDDEDSSNANTFTGDTSGTSGFIEAGSDTVLHLVRAR